MEEEEQMDEAARRWQASSGLDMVSPQLPMTELVPDARTLFPCIPRAWIYPSETCVSRGWGDSHQCPTNQRSMCVPSSPALPVPLPIDCPVTLVKCKPLVLGNL